MFVVQYLKLLFSFSLVFILAVTISCGGRPESAQPIAQSRPEPPLVGPGADLHNQSTALQTQIPQPQTQVPSPSAQSNGSQTHPTDPRTQVRTATPTTTIGTTTTHHVYLYWQPSKSSVIGYYIYRGLSATGPFTRLNSSPEPATLFIDNAVLAGKKYFYAITATNTQGESAYSNIVPAVIPSP